MWLKVIGFFGFTAFSFIAQTTHNVTNSSDPWIAILQWGPAGVILALLGSGQFRFNREVKKAEDLYETEKTARLQAEKERDAVNVKAAGDFIPLLTEATRLLADFRPKSADKAIATALSAIAEKLDDIESGRK